MKIAFVDPIASPVYLTQTLKSQGLDIVAIYTLKDLSPQEKKVRFRPELFNHTVLVENQTIESVAADLKQIGVKGVFCGYEGSIKYADQLANIVGPEFANDQKTTNLRYDKYAMQEALRNNNLPAPEQLLFLNKKISEENNAALAQFKFPAILKPADGSSTIGVTKCNSIAEVEHYLKIAADRQMHATPIQNYVLQEYLEGNEYLVDTFSIAGKVYLAGIQRYGKTYVAGMPIYRFAESIEPTSIDWNICFEFVQKVLTTVGLQNGFAHTEMFVTQHGPRLVEVNPRISGAQGFLNKLHNLAYGQDQTKIMAELLLQQEKPLTQSFANRYGRIVMLQNWQPKKMKELNRTLLTSLSSYIEHCPLKSVGDSLEISRTLNDTVAFVLLGNQDKTQVLADYQQLMEWEAQDRLF